MPNTTLTAEQAAMLLPYAKRLVDDCRTTANDQLLHSPMREAAHARTAAARELAQTLGQAAEGVELPGLPTTCPECGISAQDHVSPKFWWKWLPCSQVVLT